MAACSAKTHKILVEIYTNIVLFVKYKRIMDISLLLHY